MKPDTKFDKPGKSPFMDMDLVPKYADESGDKSSGGIRIDPTQVQNLGLKTQKVTRGMLNYSQTIPANVSYNEYQFVIVQARSDGFVEKVYPLTIGDHVKKGTPLIDITIPEWVEAQSEFLLLSGNLTNFRSFITFAVVTGIILTGINMLLVSNAMSGVTDLRELSIHVIEMVIEETDVGISWIVRLCALFTTLGALFLYTNKRVLSCLLMTMSGGVALATLAWGGHAVMHDGLHYYLHLLSDLTHLGAAGAWTGALVAFAILLMRRNEHNAQSVIVISDSLAKFATAGTVIVVALILSALVNYLYIAEGNLTPLFNSSWGRILLAKTALFVLMLLLAAANRFHLGPRLEVMVREGNYDRSVALMRNSILTEFVVAIIILGAVAWLGMLAPSQVS
ncbi:cation efflux system protein CusB [Escherichia coli 2-156-04_S4_C2]|nr:cation efflux system protein CusB [Escherichia coli 2-156-04_S4_C2]